MAVILNCRFTTTINYHDSLHGLLVGRGTGTATLKVMLLQQVAALREAVFRALFLYLQKAYDALDRYRCLDFLEGYGMGPMALHLLHSYWERLKMVEQAGGYYRSPYRGERRFTQGNPLQPTIFNEVMNAVVYHWE